MTHLSKIYRLVALAAALLLAAAAPRVQAQPGEVRVLSSNGVRAALEQLLPRYERSSGKHIAIEYGTSASLKQRIEGGEPVDAVFLTSDTIGDLVKAGKIAANSLVTFGGSGIGIGVRANDRRLDISTPAAIKQSLLAASAVTFARNGASRARIEEMFDRLGIAAEMQPKTLLESGSGVAAERVMAGDAEFLITLVSEILPVEGMVLLGPLPDEFQSYVMFGGGMGTSATNTAGAKELLDFLSGPAAAPVFDETGISRVTDH
jgi:molybdate transport system substrate-binding protein